jgi:TonB-dependent starch-binding outer membrane protein SusC
MKLHPTRQGYRSFCKRLQFFFLLLLISTISLLAQEQTVTGQVTDAKENPLPGVNVLIKGTRRGTATDAMGRFTLTNVPQNATLVISSQGFASQEVPVSGRNGVINLTLEEQVSNLNEVVVIGYGTQQKKDLTGAVSSIKATKLENENPNNVQDVIRGNIPGVSVTTSTSAKGGGDLLIRGRSSITAESDPLIVLDGVIYIGALSDINPNDINTIDVLKDASSAAVFGAKSGSGVILITTKRGTKSKPTVTLNTNVGFGELAMDEPLYDGPGFVAWRTDVLKSINVNAQPFRFNDPRTLPSNITIAQWKAYDNSQGDSIDIWLNRLKLLSVEVGNYKAGKTVNWYDMMFQKGLRQDHTLSLSGRKEDVNYYMSVGYTNNQGIIVGDSYKVFRTRLNLEAKAASFATVGVNLQFSDRNESQVPVSWGQMVNASPYGEIYKADGVTLRDSPNDDIGNNTNPFLDNTYTNRLQKYNTFFGSLYAKGDLPFGFSYQVNFTPNFEFYRYFNAISAKDFRYSVRKGVATRTEQTIYNWQWDNLLKWNKTFGEHSFDVTFLANMEKFQSWRNQMDNEGFDPNDNLSYHNIGLGIKPVISSDDQVQTGDAFMARLNYSLMDKYLFTGTFRRDGFSAFGRKNPRADFPALSLGWVFTRENFASNINWLNYGKLRLSWGVNGNRDIGRYAAISRLTGGKYQYIKPDGTIVLVSQLWTANMQNDNLKWESTDSYNIGFDFSILNDRLGGSIDVYQKVTSNLLVLRRLPDVTGFDNVIDNIGRVDNKGIEIMINSSNIQTPNFSWRSTVTYALNKNKVVHLFGPVPLKDSTGKVIGTTEANDVPNRWFIGHDINAIWDLKVLGVWQSNEAAEAAKYGVKPGDFKIQDVNGDGKFSDADRQFLGYSTPRHRLGLRNEFTFLKNFDLSFMIYAYFGHLRDFNQAKNNSGFIDRQNSYKFPYWTPENPINNYARLFSSNGSAGFSVYRKADVIRLNNIALAYTLPAALVQRAKIESLKIYANVTNAAVYQPDWTFWDVEYGNTPSPRYYQLGMNVSF